MRPSLLFLFMISLSLAHRSLSFSVAQQSRLSLRCFASVSGTVYKGDGPTIQLFTKEGCTLCDKVKDVLLSIRKDYPHNLEQVDITDKENREWFDKYKYDIPVLHLEGEYWIKHRMTVEQAMDGLDEHHAGTFVAQAGEPNAAATENKQ